jgi:phosphoribosylformimino-5-aminoimidazole carboxamide ribotide isomerase
VKIFFAMDLIAGKAVRLVKGDFAQATVYSEEPLVMIEAMRKSGAKDFHIIDLDGARTGARVHADLIASIRQRVPGYMEVGGGIRSEEDIAYYSGLEVNGVIVGTRALEDRAFFKGLSRFGNIVLGLDVANGKPMVKGWKEAADISTEEVIEIAASTGIMAILFTSIARDGTLSGPDFNAITALQRMTQIPIIASGGVSTIEDVRELKEMGVWAAIVGKAFYEGRITIEEAMHFAD